MLLTICVGLFTWISCLGQAPFVTTWKTDNLGNSCATCITIPTVGGGYDYEVDWDNDGTYDESGIAGEVTHDFGEIGTYTIAIRGEFPRIAFDNIDEGMKLLSVDQWGDIQWLTMSRAFAGCENMTIAATDAPDLSSVTSLGDAFAGCRSMDGSLSNWDVAGVENFSSMLMSCTSYNEDIGSWDVSSATDMSSMFSGAVLFNQAIGDWDVSNVSNMSGMFNFALMFDQDIGAWDVSQVNDMRAMFDGAEVFNQDIGGWDVSSVVTMSSMFGSAAQVIFPRPSAFNQDIGDWDVSNVLDMAEMFMGAESFNQDISRWDVSNVNVMQSMFRDAEGFDQNLGDWTLASLFRANFMFNDSGLSCSNYSSSLQGWAANNSTVGIGDFGARGLIYSAEAAEARMQLIELGWFITGDEEGSCATSTDVTTAHSVKVFPNPTKDNIYVEGAVTEYTLFDQTGRVVISSTKAMGGVKTETLPAGVYFLKLSTAEGLVLPMERIVKI